MPKWFKKNTLLMHFNDDRYYIWNVQLVFDTCITTANQHMIPNRNYHLYIR